MAKSGEQRVRSTTEIQIEERNARYREQATGLVSTAGMPHAFRNPVREADVLNADTAAPRWALYRPLLSVLAILSGALLLVGFASFLADRINAGFLLFASGLFFLTLLFYR